MDRLCATRCILPTHVYIYTSVHVYIAYDARTVAFIFGRERERGRGEGAGSVVSNSAFLARAHASACVRACARFATRRRTSCVTADTRASTHGRENPAGAYAAGFCMRGGAGRGGSVVSSLLLFGTRYADLT